MGTAAGNQSYLQGTELSQRSGWDTVHGKVLVKLFEYAIADNEKPVEPDKKQIDVQIDVIANQAVVLFTCPAGKKTYGLKKKINELTKEWEGNTEVKKDEGRMKICVTFVEKN